VYWEIFRKVDVMEECPKCGSYIVYTKEVVYGWCQTAEKFICMECGYEEYLNIQEWEEE